MGKDTNIYRVKMHWNLELKTSNFFYVVLSILLRNKETTKKNLACITILKRRN